MVISTLNAKFGPESLQSFSRRLHPAFFGILQAHTNRGDCFQLYKAIEQFLITCSVLHNKFRAAIDRQYQRSFRVLEPADVIFGISLELSNGADLAEIDHGRLDMHKAYYKHSIQCLKRYWSFNACSPRLEIRNE